MVFKICNYLISGMNRSFLPVKKSIFLWLCVFVALFQFGCGSGDSVEQVVIYNTDEADTVEGFSEYDFCSNPALYVKPGDIAAIFLEPSDATDTILPDTNGLGEDIIPLKITESGQYYYSMDTESNVIRAVVITDVMGNEALRLDDNCPEGLLYLSPGIYTATVTSGYKSAEMEGADHMVVFLCPDMGELSRSEAFKQVFRLNSAPWAELGDINLSHANLAGADLYYVNLKKANMNAVSLEKANLEGANLEEAVLYGAELGEVNLHTANLKKAYLHAADLEKANLSGADLSEAYLYAANMDNADLAGASLENAYLYAANLKETNFISADLSGANLFSAQMESVNLLGACLDDAYLYAANLSIGNMEGASMKRVNLAAACLKRANLHNADLSGANLADADLTYSVLKNAILSGANLEGADLTGADTTGVVW